LDVELKAVNEDFLMLKEKKANIEEQINERLKEPPPTKKRRKQ